MAINMNLRDYARRLRRAALRGRTRLRPTRSASIDYSQRLQAEEKFFNDCQDVNQLPEFYDYWSNKYLRPKLEQLGFSHPEAMFSHYFAEAYTASARTQRAYVSVGAGNCETEVRLAEDLTRRGHTEFVIECVEFNTRLLQQGSELAQRKGLAKHIVAVGGDFNKWSPTTTYDGVLANNSLHHVLNLEGLLGAIRASLEPTGFFVTSDMIGRNGHMRWPEALEIVHEYWRELPKQYTYNNLLKRYEAIYDNWDCSADGFEGIRAQDILRLLIDHFEFALFVPFANVIDPFIDRTFGHNFRSSVAWDRAFIDRLHARDEAEILRGAIKPTHILAAMCTEPSDRTLLVDGLTPEFCIRSPEARPVPFRELQTNNVEPTQLSDPGVPTDAVSHRPEFTGADGLRASPASRVDYTDMWWNPQESGWGISIHHHRNDQLIAIWCIYDADGAPTWYLLQPGGWTGPSTFVGPIYVTSGPHVDAPYSSRPVSTRCVGSATLDFTDHSNGTLAYTLDAKAGQKTICRMRF
jgi:SAM-dependent methyltransferase